MQVGFDIEPLDRPRIREILPLMAAGAELQHLESCWDADPTTASELTTEVWVAKEAIQKAAGVGMGLAPQSFSILQPSEFASAGCDKYSSIEQPFSSSSGEQSPVYLKQRQLSVDGREFQLWLWRTEMQNRPVSVGLAIMKTD
jgi:phosphopantetheinyl transferase